MRRRRPVLLLILISLFLEGCTQEARTSRDAVHQSQFERQAVEKVQQLIAHDFAGIRADFDETMLEGLSEEELKQALADVEAQWGELEGQAEGDLEVVQRDELTVVNVPVQFHAKVAEVRVTFRENGEIAGFFILEPDVPVP